MQSIKTQPNIHKSQLFPGEWVTEANTDDGYRVTLIMRPDQLLYTAPGRAANFAGVGDTLLPDCHYFFSRLGSSRVQIQLNTNGSLSINVVSGNHGKCWQVNLRQGGEAFKLESMEAK
jgi:hypothetical protein